MKRITVTLAACWCMLASFGQAGFNKAEYFFDNDPGIGNGIAVPINGANEIVDLSFQASTGSLATGFHFMGIRFKQNDGLWGLFETRRFYILSAPSSDVTDITGAEYFFDQDPGKGAGVPLTIGTSGPTVNFTAIIPVTFTSGFHFLAVRVKDSQGKWSLFETRRFFMTPPVAADVQNVKSAEYFFDNDPGVGKALPLNVTTAGAIVNFTASILQSLTPGFHFIGLRLKDNQNRWGMFETRRFYVISPSTDRSSISAAEVYFDTDPGVGNGIPVTVPVAGDIVDFSPSILIPCMSAAQHRMYLRFRDQDKIWGHSVGQTITVNSGVAAPVVTPATPDSICVLNTITLSTPAAAGVTYQWLRNNSPVSGETNASITTNIGGAYTLKATCNGQNTTSNAVVVRVAQVLNTIGSVIGQQQICINQSNLVYSVTPVAEATGYNWVLPPGMSLSSGFNTPSITVSTDASFTGGTIKVQGTNKCGVSSFSTKQISKLDPPGAAGTISGPATVCLNQGGFNYSVTPVTDATTYTWELPTGMTISSAVNNSSITVSVGSTFTGGLLRVQPGNKCGIGGFSPDFFPTHNTVGVPGNITGAAAVCPNQTGIAFSVPAVNNATGYTWILPAGMSITASDNTASITVSTSTSFIGGTIKVQGTSSCGSGAFSPNFNVVNNTLPAAGTITGPASVCAIQTGFVFTVPSQSAATGYNWVLPAGMSITAGGNTNSITVSTGSGFTGGIIKVQGTNACGSGGFSPDFSIGQTTAVPPIPAPINGITGTLYGVCPGTTISCVTSAPGATSFLWKQSFLDGNGVRFIQTVTGGSSEVMGVFPTGYSSASLSVAGKNCFGTGVERVLAIELIAPQLDPISGQSSEVCAGTTKTYSIASMPAGFPDLIKPFWEVPPGATILSGGQNTLSIMVKFGSTFTSGLISVRGVNSQCSGDGPIRTLTVKSKPDQPGVISGQSTGVCPSTTQTYTIDPLPAGVSPRFALFPGVTYVVHNLSVTVNFGSAFSTGNLEVRAANGCGYSVPRTLTISSKPLSVPGPIIGPLNGICPSNPPSYSVAAMPAGATSLLWTLEQQGLATFTLSTTSLSFPSNGNGSGSMWSAPSGRISVQAVNACGVGTNVSSLSFTSLPPPTGVISGSKVVCPLGTTYFFESTPPSGSILTWSFSVLNPAGSASIASVSNAGNKTAKIQFNSNFISGTIKAIASNACGTSPSFNTFAITAAPPTPGPISLNPVSPYCSNIIPKATIAAVAGTTEYQWSTVSTTTPVIQFSKFANGSSLVNSLKTTSPEAYLVLPTTSVSISKTIKVKAKNTCGTSGGRQATITINSCQAKPYTVTSSEINSSALAVYPNPTTGITTLSFSSNESGRYRVEVKEALGKTVKTETITVTEGENQYRLDLSRLAKGTYMVILRNKKTNEMTKVVLQ